MGLALPEEVADFIARHHVMSLATQGDAGPWSAAVFYARHAGDLVFLSAPNTRHGSDLARDARCAATIQGQPEDWRSIRGVQLEGRADVLHGAELVAARDAYAARFPFVRAAAAPAAIAAALARVQWYRLRVARLCFVDNAQGLGARRCFDA